MFSLFVRGQEVFLMNSGKTMFQKGQKKREELQLPVLHFVTADDWIDKLGYEAFCAWLKFYTWCDRSQERSNKENDVVPTSFKKIMERLGIGRKKFYNSVIRPLWNYGLIDIVEYTDSNNEGQKPMNIIVYEYPQNDITKKYQPLEKIRDYDDEYTSNARTFAKQGGRKKNECSGGVSHGNRGGFHTETEGGFTQKPNNDSNSITNDSNNITNDSNLSIQKADIQKMNFPISIQKILNQNIDRLIDDNISLSDIETLYNSFKDTVNDFTFSFILGNVLGKTKGKINDISNLMNVSVYNHLKQLPKSDNKTTQENKEVIPDWFNENKEQATAKKDEGKKELSAEERQELEDILKRHSSRKTS